MLSPRAVGFAARGCNWLGTLCPASVFHPRYVAKGFVAPEGGGKDVFVHATAVEAAGIGLLNEGDKVTFDVQPNARGSKAVNLKAA